MEGKEKEEDEKDEKMKSTEKMVSEDEALGEENGIMKEEPTNIVSNSSPAPEAHLETDVRETSATETVIQAAEDASETGNDKTPAGKETSMEATIPKFPKVKCPHNISLLLFPVQQSVYEGQEVFDTSF